VGVRKLHRFIGLLLLLPFFGWVITGFVFFLKPGYTGAYATLNPKTYAIEHPLTIHPDPEWLEFRYLRTVLGEHLLARTASGWRQFGAEDKLPRPVPGEQQLTALLADAVSVDPTRYGRITRISDDRAITDTGIEISIDWDSLSFQQRGKDTRRLDFLYRIHYLQWTGNKVVDNVLGFCGLLLVGTLAVLGARLAVARASGSEPRA
jgi:hypothetical protein